MNYLFSNSNPYCPMKIEFDCAFWTRVKNNQNLFFCQKAIKKFISAEKFLLNPFNLIKVLLTFQFLFFTASNSDWKGCEIIDTLYPNLQCYVFKKKWLMECNQVFWIRSFLGWPDPKAQSFNKWPWIKVSFIWPYTWLWTVT